MAAPARHASPLTPRLSDSVPPEVNTISSGATPRKRATRSRAAVEPVARLAAEAVDARRVAEALREVGQHLGQHLGVHRRRRVVIEIDADGSSAWPPSAFIPDVTRSAAMDLAGRSSVCCSPPAPSTPTSRPRSGSPAALDRGADLYLYLIDDGVRALDDPRVHACPPRRQAVRVRLRLPEAPPAAAHADTVTYCGLVVLTDLINGTDRFIALN